MLDTKGVLCYYITDAKRLFFVLQIFGTKKSAGKAGITILTRFFCIYYRQNAKIICGFSVIIIVYYSCVNYSETKRGGNLENKNYFSMY